MDPFMDTSEQLSLYNGPTTIVPDSEESLEQQLEAVNREWAAELRVIEQTRQAQASVEEQLNQLHEQIGALSRQARQHSNEIRARNNQIRRHKDKRYEIESAIRVRDEANAKKAALEANREILDKDSWRYRWRTGTNDGFKALQHQIDGAYFLAESGRGAILADSMGLGKTGTSLFACDLAGAKRILIVCPGEIMSGFAKEIVRWTDRPAMVIGKKPKSFVRQIFTIRRNAKLSAWVDIINYEAWARDKVLLTELEGMQYDTVIVDEAHNIKETDTSAFQGVRQIVTATNQCQSCGAYVINGICTKAGSGCPSPKNIGRSVSRVFCMTGTPILNRPEELYALLNLIDPLNFSRKRHFTDQYCRLDYNTGKYVFRPGGEAELAERLSGMYLRRTHKSANIHVPKQDIIIHELELDEGKYPKQAEILKTLAEHAAIEIEEGRATSMMHILQLITRQRQAATWPGGIVLHETKIDPDTGEPIRDQNDKVVKIDIPIGLKFAESTKIDRAVELTQEFIEDEQRVVIFSQFRETLAELKRRFDTRGIRAAEFHGGTPAKERERIKSNFDRHYLQQTGTVAEWDVVLCHYRTGGVGLNLTAATATIILDEEWNPGKNQQAYDRTHRMGQTEETSVHILRLANSIDAWMAELNENKAELISGFNDANEEAKKELISMFRKDAA